MSCVIGIYTVGCITDVVAWCRTSVQIIFAVPG